MSMFNQLFLHCGCCYVEVQFFWRHEHAGLLRDAKKRGPLFRVGSGDNCGVCIVVGQVGALSGHPPHRNFKNRQNKKRRKQNRDQQQQEELQQIQQELQQAQQELITQEPAIDATTLAVDNLLDNLRDEVTLFLLVTSMGLTSVYRLKDHNYPRPILMSLYNWKSLLRPLLLD